MTEDEWNMIDYFYNDKGDVTRWCDWEKFKAANPTHPIVEGVARAESAHEAVKLMIRGARP